MNEREIFIAALEIAAVKERLDYLGVACGGDSALRQRIEDLLHVHEQKGDFLQKPLVERLVAGVAALDNVANTACDSSANRLNKHGIGFLSPSERPGSLGKLGHYEVQEVIGSGGMGIVLRAFDEKLHRMVAIKAMAAQLATNAPARKRFLREARAAAAVCHDHIVTIHAVEDAGELPYLVMQYVSGMSLQERIDRDGPLALHEILRIGMQTAAGLAAAHVQGLIHRDVKPANILLENGVERVKITDFGLARAAADASVSQSGSVAGTPQYMAPEQARGEALDGRADLFSLGSVLYAMCTGRAPFRAANSMAVLKRLCEDTPSPIREANADIPEWLDALIAKLHAKLPDERTQTAAEVVQLLAERLAQLQQWANHVPVVAAKPMPARAATRPWRSRTVAAVVLLSLAATLGVAEGMGVTSIAASVIRILTPDGTLIVQVDDPGVAVTIEGDGGLVISGAGPKEVRLRPGSYRLRADKDGRPIPVDQPLVTIERGGRQVVKVTREVAAQPATRDEKLEAAEKLYAEADEAVKLGTTGMAADPWQSEIRLRKAAEHCDQLVRDFPDVRRYEQQRARSRRLLSMALNYEAHALVYNSTALSPKEAAQAVAAGKEATELAPSDSGFWINLGMAHYRANEWQGALDALKKGPSGDDYNSCRGRFALALVHWQLGHKDEAQAFFDRAVKWMEQNKPDDRWLRRDRAEASALLQQ
jgi:hypothetical protein